MPEVPGMELGAASRKYSVLIADDSRNDRFLLKRAIRSGAPSLTVVGEAEDGAKTIAYLSGKDNYANRGQYPFPDLLFLDLKMPCVDGFEVLAWLRQQAFSQLHVVVLAGLLEGGERQRMLELGVRRAYLKPWRHEALTGILKMVESDLAGVSLDVATP